MKLEEENRRLLLINGKLNERVRQLEKQVADQGWNETRPMFDSYGQYIGERS